MLDQAAAEKLAKDLLPRWEHERDRLDKIDCWYRWRQEPIELPRRATPELRKLAELSKVPWGSLVVTTVAQSMYVDGFRSQLDDPSAGVDEIPDGSPWRIWQANGFDQRQIAIHRAALAYGYSFVKILPGVNFLGEAEATMRGVSPRRMYCTWEDPASDDWPTYALEVDIRADKSYDMSLYDDTHVYYLTSDAVGGKVEYVGERVHDVGMPPVVRYCNELDLDGRTPGEIEPFIPLAARINKTSFDRMLVQHYNGWKVRTVTGMAEPETPDDAEKKKLKLRQDDLLVADDPDTKFGTLDEALALHTPLPTPAGWTTMGDVKVGDTLIGSDGMPTTVVKTTEVQTDRICYRVTFRDGTSIIASDGHRWLTRVIGHNQAHTNAQVRTTGEMFADGRRMSIPVAPPVKSPDVTLPIDPYVLGLWLGDGCRDSARISSSQIDAGELMELIQSRGYSASRGPVAPGRAERIQIGVPGAARSHSLSLQAQLRMLGLLGNKHIPAVYLRASIDQRTELLRGLMDSDGSVTAAGYCCFAQTSPEVTDDVVELLRSLGQVVTVRWRADSRSRAGGSFKVGFQTRWGLQPFALRRKAERVVPRRAHDGWTGITSIEPVPTEPVRCVAVDAADHLFLAGEGWHATHNTPLEGFIAAWRSDIEALAAVTQTPTHELTGQLANLSAEALAAARAAHTQKVTERQKSFGKSHVQSLRLAALVNGSDEYARDITGRVTWQDTQIRSISQAVDALGKAAQMLGVPVKALWGRIPGVERQDVEEWAQMALEGDPIMQMKAELERQAKTPVASNTTEGGEAESEFAPTNRGV